MSEQLQVGQKLWFVHRERRSGAPGFTTVKKVGRKWAQLDHGYRCDVESLIVDGNGYASPGRCWRSKEDWEAECRRSEAWGRLRKLIDHKWEPPEGLQTDAIEAAILLVSSDHRGTP